MSSTRHDRDVRFNDSHERFKNPVDIGLTDTEIP